MIRVTFRTRTVAADKLDAHLMESTCCSSPGSTLTMKN